MYVSVYVYIETHTHKPNMHFHTIDMQPSLPAPSFFCGLQVASLWNDLKFVRAHLGNSRWGWRRRWPQQRQSKRHRGQNFKQSTPKPNDPYMENIRPRIENTLHARRKQMQQIRKITDLWTWNSWKDEKPPNKEEYQTSAMTQDDDVEATDGAVICSVMRTLRCKTRRTVRNS